MTLDKRYTDALSSENPTEAVKRVQREIEDEQRRQAKEYQRQADIIHNLVDLLDKDRTAGKAAVTAFLAALEAE